jgi:hypothetical protein
MIHSFETRCDSTWCLYHVILNILIPSLKMMLSSDSENHEEPKAIKAAEEIKKTAWIRAAWRKSRRNNRRRGKETAPFCERWIIKC